MKAPEQFPADEPGGRAPDSAEEAAIWLARRDRGLTAREQVAFERWLETPPHARLLAELEGPFRALDRAARLRPEGSVPDADLLAPAGHRVRSPRRRIALGRGVLWVTGGLAAAAALTFAPRWPTRTATTETVEIARGGVVRRAPEHLALPDGSTVELKAGTQFSSDFTPGERRVRLSAGDAHFTVAKDAARPFIVQIGSVAVRAVGTAFTISASTATVEVIVTEGRVRVADIDGRNLLEPSLVPASPASGVPAAPATPELAAALDAGQRVVIPLGATPPVPVPVMPVTPEMAERAAAWRSVWLEFSDLPLAEVAREFNRQAASGARPNLRPADERTGRVLVSGTFRTDGVEAFVRLLQSSFGIEASQDAEGILTLRKVD